MGEWVVRATHRDSDTHTAIHSCTHTWCICIRHQKTFSTEHIVCVWNVCVLLCVSHICFPPFSVAACFYRCENLSSHGHRGLYSCKWSKVQCSYSSTVGECVTASWGVNTLCCIVGLWLMTRLLLRCWAELPSDCQPDWVYELKGRSGRQKAKLDPDVQIPDARSAPLGLQKAGSGFEGRTVCLNAHTGRKIRVLDLLSCAESPDNITFDYRTFHAHLALKSTWIQCSYYDYKNWIPILKHGGRTIHYRLHLCEQYT